MTKNNLRNIVGAIVFSFFAATQVTAQPNSYLTDGVITSKVKAKIALDKSASIFNIGVKTKNGDVLLDGIVDTDTDAQNLLQLVQTTNGVKEIDVSHLQVKRSTHPLKDTLVTAKVRANLITQHVFRDQSVPLQGITVETKDGIVYLNGAVHSQEEEQQAVNVASSTSGVLKVQSKLEITP